MRHSQLTRWIEDTEARKFHETVIVERKLEPVESQYVHLGQAIVRISTFALAYLSRPLSSVRH